MLTNHSLHFLKIARHVKVAKIKKCQDFNGWSIKGYLTKIIEQIVIDFSLVSLHQTEVLIL